MRLAALRRIVLRPVMLGAVALLAIAAPSASAGFIGSSVTGTAEFPTIGSVFLGPATTIVGAGIEFPGNLTAANIDIDDTTIKFTFPTTSLGGGPPFTGWHFKFTGAPVITGATVDGSSTALPGAVTFDDDEIFVNYIGGTTSFTSGDFALLNISFAPAGGPGAVPLPLAVWAGLALGGVVVARRTKLKA